MSSINNGGSAFPNKDELGNMILGMSLRDYFAGQALAGLCASTDHDSAPSKGILADWAYQQADAMLAAREVKP